MMMVVVIYNVFTFGSNKQIPFQLEFDPITLCS